MKCKRGLNKKAVARAIIGLIIALLFFAVCLGVYFVFKYIFPDQFSGFMKILRGNWGGG